MARQKNDGRGRMGGRRSGRIGEHLLGRVDQVNTLIDKGRPAGMHNDGNGLYLRITPTGSSSWMYRYTKAGKAHALGIGSTALVTVEAARARASEFYQAKSGMTPDGDRVAKVDPRDVRAARDSRAAAEQTAHAPVPIPTFGEVAELYLVDMHEAWKDHTEADKWRSMFRRLVPKLMATRVDEVDADTILHILRLIWSTRYKMAKTLQRRIEAVMGAAIVRVPSMRQMQNPARWRGFLDKAGLKASAKAKRIEHRKSLDWHDVPALIAELHATDHVKARAIEFVILTAARSGEVLHGQRSGGMKWTTGEIDFETATWTVPEDRMKKGRTHRVALSDRAVAILREMDAIRANELVFDVGYDTVKNAVNALSGAVLGVDAAGKNITADLHGFRQSFANWIRDTRKQDEDLADQALSHQRDNETKASYFTSDGLDNRRPIMQAWADFCLGRETVRAAA